MKDLFLSIVFAVVCSSIMLVAYELRFAPCAVRANSDSLPPPAELPVELPLSQSPMRLDLSDELPVPSALAYAELKPIEDVIANNY